MRAVAARDRSALGWPARLPGNSGRLAALAAGGAVLAVAALLQPVAALVLVTGGLGLALIVAWACRAPDRALMLAIALVLVASTKFRERDPSLSMAGSADWQVLFELALHGAVGVIALVAWLVAGRRRRVATGWIELSLLGFTLFALVSALWSPIPVLSAVRGVQLVVLALVAWVAVEVLGPGRTLDTAATSLVIYVLGSAAVAVILPGTVVGTAAISSGRFAYFAAHPLWVALQAGLAAVWVLARLVFMTRRDLGARTALLALALVALVAILVATQARAAAAALAVASAALLMRRVTPVWMVVVLVCLALGAAVLFPMVDLAPVDIVQRLEGSEGKLAEFVLRGQTTQEVMGLNGRIELWTALGELIAERPLFGHGYLSSRELVVGLISWAREGAYAHNEVAQTLLDFGIVGTLLFWLPFLGALDPGPLRGAALRDTTPAGVVRLRAAVFGAAVFLLLNAMTCEGLVAPGFGLVVCVVLALSAARLRRVRALAPAGLTPPAPRR